MVLGIGTFISDFMVIGNNKDPTKSPVFGSPEDFNLEYKDVEFTNIDNTTLRGWLITGKAREDSSPSTSNSKKIVLQSHFGVMCCRSGYTPDGKGWLAPFPHKIEFLKAVSTFIEKGYHVLMYDTSNHGNSDAGKCEYVSWGYKEADDVLAAVHYISTELQDSYDEICMLSLCMGAASTTYAYGERKSSTDADPSANSAGIKASLQEYPKIKAIVAIQPLTYKQMMINMGFPQFLNRMSLPVTEERLGFDIEAKTFMDYVSKITVPTTVIQNSKDPFHRREEVQAYVDQLTVEEKDILWLDLENNRFAGYTWVSENPNHVVEWFDKFTKP